MRNRVEDGGQEFPAHLGCVNVLFLEADAYPEALQQADGFQAVDGVAGETGDGFAEHLVDKAPPAVGDKPLELGTILGGGAGDPFVGVEVDKGPFLLGGDVGGVIPHLSHERVQLIGGIGTDPGICFYKIFYWRKGESSSCRYAKLELHKQRKGFSSEEANCIEMLPVQGVSSIAILGWAFRQQFCISI